VLGVSNDNFGRHRGDWWWTVEVKIKVEPKNIAYMKLVGERTRGIRG